MEQEEDLISTGHHGTLSQWEFLLAKDPPTLSSHFGPRYQVVLTIILEGPTPNYPTSPTT